MVFHLTALSLSAIESIGISNELEGDIFPPERMGVDGHTHRDMDQVLTVLDGSLELVVSDGRRHRRIRLDHPGKRLYLPRMLWVRMYDFTPPATALAAEYVFGI